MMDRHREVITKFNAIKKRIHISNHFEYAIALEALKQRLLHIVEQIYANELFDNGSLKLSDLDQANSLEEVKMIVDNFESIARFYEKNYGTMAPITEMQFFQEDIAKEGDINCWNEVTSHQYRGLSRKQSTTLVLDTLTRHHPVLQEESDQTQQKPKSSK
jgi:hypothetical protein